ncbi:methyltransferase domain-containing protein [uncultured Psychroserpens sp.]|uniref:class I SAM-dependent methyltransferase n=1 Tax=uncultured Psychroserpens sp. TaxID=255436 RepID=UPI00261D7D6F|nr:methyltransferase domain-containing protein [uncultured Psychroserpens sp.]
MKNKKTKTPWPTKDVMSQIYEMNLWGSDNSLFYSGEGSHVPSLVNPYINALSLFLRSFKTPLTVCDLGCGDFNIGKELVEYTKTYHAIDIVKELIEFNKEKFKSSNLEFHCLDISLDSLPQGECAILRQVLQHLSNVEVKSVLSKLSNFKYLVLTEHIPVMEFTPNKDIISGQGTRLKKDSGIDLLAPPFNFKVAEAKELLSISLGDSKGKIVTTLYTVF